MLITILTSTYNRSYTLKRLYWSLVSQKKHNFIWLIIDDGSTDNTNHLIESFRNEGRIKIEYLYQENGGKHRALNRGINKIKSELTFIVDSDDYLPSNATSIIEQYYKKYCKNDKIAGFSFLMQLSNGKINGKKYEKSEFIGNYIDVRINSKDIGDKAEVFLTKKLSKYPFLEISGEKFLTECYVWFQLGIEYNMVYINKVIKYGEYLPDGLSNNIYKIMYNNPLGMIETCLIMCNDRLSLKNKTKNMIKYITFSKIANIKTKKQIERLDKKYRMIYYLFYIFGIISYLYFLYIVRGHKNERFG